MNEQIKQLSKQCYETGPIGKDGWPEYSRLNEVKFAELIVRECMEVANKNRTEMEIKTNTHLTADAIKKHFGVEL